MTTQDWIAAFIALAAFGWLVRHFRSMVTPARQSAGAGGEAQSPCGSCGMCPRGHD